MKETARIVFLVAVDDTLLDNDLPDLLSGQEPTAEGDRPLTMQPKLTRNEER